MKAKTYFFRLSIAFLTFLISIGVYVAWNVFPANTHQSNITSSKVELASAVTETYNSNDKSEAVCCPKQTGNVIVTVKRFISKTGDKCYRYTVKNDTNLAVQGIDVGIDSTTDSSQLKTFPKGWSVNEFNGGTIESPNSTSMVEAYTEEESDKIYILPKTFWVEPGKSSSFHVCMQSKWDSTYETASWKIYKYDGSYGYIKGRLMSLNSK